MRKQVELLDITIELDSVGAYGKGVESWPDRSKEGFLPRLVYKALLSLLGISELLVGTPMVDLLLLATKNIERLE